MQVLAELAAETDYDNFKSEVARHQGKAGTAYEHLLHDVWSVMHKLQETEGLAPITADQIRAAKQELDELDLLACRPDVTPLEVRVKIQSRLDLLLVHPGDEPVQPVVTFPIATPGEGWDVRKPGEFWHG